MFGTIRLPDSPDDAHATAFFKISVDERQRRAPGELRLIAPEAQLPSAALVGCDDVVKDRTDVVALGSAFAPGGRPVHETSIRVASGDADKRVAVFGRRRVRWSGSRPLFDAPEPFTEVVLDNRNAYGGIDLRVPVPPPSTIEEMARLLGHYPGLYPRNPVGKGYVVVPQPVEAELPQLENPDDLLSPDRLVVGDASRWWQQPMPWNVGFTELAMFPRLLPLGASPWFAAPDDARLDEVRRGILPAGYASTGTLPRSVLTQEGSAGLVFDELAAGTPLLCEGMHPEGGVVRWRLPAAPRCRITVEQTVHEVTPRLTLVRLLPAVGRMDLTYAARAPLHRAFIPRVHKHIPIAVAVEGFDPFRYEAPPTLHEALQRGGFFAGRSEG
ncbi:MAG TPA: DUF2169 domain-containing protein [Minicystis sp.]|nr:DUF2169 domain-containing protein [Minicystis sp.]